MPIDHIPSTIEREMEMPANDAEKTVVQTREKIARTMSLADLQIELLGLDMRDPSPDKAQDLFARHENDPIALRLKERLEDIIEIRRDLNDGQLLELFFGFSPLGPVRIQPTPVSLSMDFYNPIDWAKITLKKGSLLYKLASFLLIKGFSTRRGFHVIDKTKDTRRDCVINIDCHRAYGVASLKKIKEHELRHSMNYVVSDRYFSPLWHLENHLHENDEELTERTLTHSTQHLLAHLKDELAAFIVAGNKSEMALKYFVFPLGPLADTYAFKNIDSSFLDAWRKKGMRESVITRVKKELPNQINVTKILEQSFRAVELLEHKGYSRDWAVSFLCADDNLRKNWFHLATICPEASARYFKSFK